MSSHNYKTWVEVDKKALLNNAKIVRGLLKPGTQLMAVVKSNAYGHGLVETAKIFCGFGADLVKSPNGDHGASWLGVDSLDEAILLREVGIKTPILVMGYTSAERIKKSAIYDLRFTIYDSEIPKWISKNCKLETENCKLHLKIDTGMSRQGVTLADLPKFIKKLPKGTKIEGVFTHFANADNLHDRNYPNLQLANFKKALEILEKSGIKPTIRHASATTGLLTMPEAQFDMVRVGIALYGLWPSIEFAQKFDDLDLKPALSWKTRIVQIKKIKKNTPIGYGITEKVKQDSTIAILPVGYYDGYFRNLSSASEVLIGGQRCKILGRISMNLSVADISNVKNVQIWDEVVLIGGQNKERITAEELAKKADAISYEVVSRINPLLSRVYI